MRPCMCIACSKVWVNSALRHQCQRHLVYVIIIRACCTLHGPLYNSPGLCVVTDVTNRVKMATFDIEQLPQQIPMSTWLC